MNELGHGLLPVTSVTTLNVADELPGPPATGGVGELEGPERGSGLLEVGTASGNLVDEVLKTDDTVLAELLLNDGVVGDGDSLAVNLGVASLVDKLSDSLEVNLTVGDVRVDKVKHLLGSLGDTNEDTVVDLKESEKLEDLLGLGGNLGDTLKSDDEVDLGLSRDVEVTSLPRLTLESDLLLLGVEVLLDILVGPLENDLSLGLLSLPSLSGSSQLGLSAGLVGAPLLEQGLRDGDLLGGRHGGRRSHFFEVT